MATEKQKPEILSRPANRKTPARMRVFLAVYSQCGQVREAARIAGINPRTHYRKLKDPVYKTAFDDAEAQAAQALEDEAVRRAVAGVKRPILYQGAPVKLGRRTLYHVEYSDALLIALLKRFRPQFYRENLRTEVSGTIDIVDRLQAARKRLVEMSAQDSRATG